MIEFTLAVAALTLAFCLGFALMSGVLAPAVSRPTRLVLAVVASAIGCSRP